MASPRRATPCRTPARAPARCRTVGAVRSFLLAALVASACAPAGSSDPEATSASADATTSGAPTSTGPLDTTATTATTGPVDCAAESDDLFTRRIAPLLATDRPKTCNTCHLSGVDLQMFVQDTPCQTMACLDARGLVDLTDPASSVVLQWISRADPSSPLITQAVIDEEYAAFLAWIEASATCGLCYAGDSPCGVKADDGCAEDPDARPYRDPGDCSPLTRETLFRHKVYAWRDRCYPCHFDSSAAVAPKWIASGPCDIGSLETMRNVLDGGLIDYADPAASLLLTKPLAEDAGGVEHGGGDKFHDLEDSAYLDIRAWIERETACTP
jgi:hypothetical protein